MRVTLLLLTILAFALPQPQRAHACGPVSLCEAGNRSYNALPPPGWDGVSPLPVLIHFHGWGRAGKNVTSNKRITGPAGENGLLLLAPNGIGKSWSFWSNDTKDAPFIDRMLEDAAKRWRIDRERVYVSGFSYGGSMVWRLACIKGNAFAGYLPIAGGLWQQSEIECKGPVNLMHLHGLNDNVWGLPVGPLDNLDDGVLLWRRMNQVGAKPQSRFDHARYDCRHWDGLKSLMLCTHEGGHYIPRDWLGWALPRMMALHSRG